MTTKSLSGPLQISASDVVAEPFPHIIKNPFVDLDLYDRLVKEFPRDDLFEMSGTQGGRAGRDIYPGDEAYQIALNESPAWKEFMGYLNSEAFMRLTLDVFGPYLKEFGCQVDPDKASFEPFVEGRETLAENSRLKSMMGKKLDQLKGNPLKDQLFVRADFAQGAVGYGKPVHCDRPNRLISLIIYFCDADEIEMEGGELRIHKHKKQKAIKDYERHPDPKDTEIVAELRAQKNLGVYFIGCNNSYHEATGVRSQKGYRNFIYCSVSSRAKSIW